MPEPVSVSRATRRKFLDLALGAGATAWLTSVIYPVLKYLKPLPRSGPAGPTRLTRDELSKLESDRFVIVPVGGKRVLVLEQPDRTVLAFDAKCTHEGCTVQYLPEDAIVWCACHNGRFDLDGRVLSGPPPRPLPRYTVERDEEGGLTIVAEAHEHV